MENDKVKGGKATKRKQIVPSDCAELVEQNEFSQITRDGAGQCFVLYPPLIILRITPKSNAVVQLNVSALYFFMW